MLELAEVDVGIDVVRRLVLPVTPDAWGTPDAIVLRRLDDRRSGCVRLEDVVRCAAHKAGSPEEARDVRRRFVSPASDVARVRMLVSPDPGPELDKVILEDQPLSVTATSAGVDDPRARPVAAVDGDTGTTWTASSAALNPELRLSWLGQRTVTGLGMSVNRVVAARLPQRVELSWPGGTRTVSLRRGSARFDPIRTDQLTIKVLDAEPAADLGFDGSSRSVPIGVSELVLQGVPYLPLNLPDEPVRTRCGTGPTIRNNAVSHRTRVVGSPADMLNGRRLEAVLCRGATVPLSAGVNDVDLLASGAFVPDVLVLGDPLGVADGTALLAEQPDPVLRRVDVPAGGGVATRENASPGWTASIDGREVAPTVFDGWRQGWTTPAAGSLVMSFAPDGAYRAALLGGAVALGGLLVVAWAVRRVRRGARESGRRGRLPALAHAAALLLVAGLVAGHAGVVVSLVGAAGAVALHRRAPEVGAWWLGAPLVASYAAYALRPWGGSAGWAGQLAWPHLLVLLSLSAVAVWVWLDEEGRVRPSRRAGRSTTR